MPILSLGRLLLVEVDAPEVKSLIGSYWGKGVKGFIETGDLRHLRPFRDHLVQGYPLDTDPDAIEAFYTDTDFDFQELYQP
jgi:hypothetical protein